MKNSIAKILVVEDYPGVYEFMLKILKQAGAEVFHAADGSAALTAVDQYMPDLVFLDINIPVIDGFQVCRQIKKDSKTKHIPVVIFTVRNQAWERELGRKVGVDEYLCKPMDYNELIDVAIKYCTGLNPIS